MRIPVKKLLLSEPFRDASFIGEKFETDKKVCSINIIDNPYGFQFVEKESLLIIGGQDWYLSDEAQEDIFNCLSRNNVSCIALYYYDETLPFCAALGKRAAETGIPILQMGESARKLPYGKILEYFSEHYYIVSKDGFLQKGYIQQQMYDCAGQDKLSCIAKKLWLYTGMEVYARIDDMSYHYGSKTDIEALLADQEKWVAPTGLKAQQFENGLCYYYGPQETYFSLYVFDKKMDNDLIMLVGKNQIPREQELQILQFAYWAILADFKRNSIEFSRQQTEKIKMLLDNEERCAELISSEDLWGDNPGRVLVMNTVINKEELQSVHREAYKLVQKTIGGDVQLLFGDYKGDLVMLLPAEFIESGKKEKLVRIIRKFAVPGRKLKIGYGDATVRDGLPDSYRQARKALFWANNQERTEIIGFSELGFLALLEEKKFFDRIREYDQRYLRKLLEYDEKNNTELYYTLTIYIGALWNFSSASKLLFIHLNTVKYRIEQAERIMGLNFGDSDVRTNLEVAVKIREFMGEGKLEV